MNDGIGLKGKIVVAFGAVLSVFVLVGSLVLSSGGNDGSIRDLEGGEGYLVMPNVAVPAAPWEVPVYQGSSDEESRFLKVPIVDTPCPIEASGAIGAPDDYTTACRFKIGEAEAIISHAVRGAEFGVFEHLDLLKVGQEVNLDGVWYEVESVDIYENTKLPQDIFKGDTKTLITCTLMDIHEEDPAAPWTHNTVVKLKEKNVEV